MQAGCMLDAVVDAEVDLLFDVMIFLQEILFIGCEDESSFYNVKRWRKNLLKAT